MGFFGNLFKGNKSAALQTPEFSQKSPANNSIGLNAKDNNPNENLTKTTSNIEEKVSPEALNEAVRIAANLTFAINGGSNPSSKDGNLNKNREL